MDDLRQLGAVRSCIPAKRPISVMRPSDQPLSLEWWQSNPQAASSGSARHAAALTLHLEIAKASRIPLPKDTFPARLDFDDETMRPDKGVMKVVLDEGLVTARQGSAAGVRGYDRGPPLLSEYSGQGRSSCGSFFLVALMGAEPETPYFHPAFQR